MSEMPQQVREAARQIAIAAFDKIREAIADQFSEVDSEVQAEFVAAICQMMSDLANQRSQSNGD